MNKAGGFITIHRKILDWGWFKKTNTFHLFIYLLLTANFADGYFEGRLVKRGQLATSLPSISTGTGLSIQQIRTALNHLISTGEVTDESCHQYRIITVVKYDEYQKATGKSTDDQQTINRQSNRQSTDESTDDQQQYNNNNKYNKETNKQGNNNNTSPASRESVRPDDFDFEVFWQAYPKKVSKPDAIKAWKKIKPDELMQREIIRGLMRWKGSDQWTRDGGQYIPYPATWLNRRGWEDECPAARPERKPEPAKPPVRVTAQEYEQRDYTGVDDDLMDEQARMIEDALRRGII